MKVEIHFELESVKKNSVRYNSEEEKMSIYIRNKTLEKITEGLANYPEKLIVTIEEE